MIATPYVLSSTLFPTLPTNLRMLRCCSVLQCIAACSSVLQRVALRGSVFKSLCTVLHTISDSTGESAA